MDVSEKTSAADKKKREVELKRDITRKLMETGEMERLKDLLRTRLTECGWKDQMRAECKAVIQEVGVENVKVDDLVTKITPKGRASVPDSVKKDLLEKIRTYLEG